MTKLLFFHRHVNSPETVEILEKYWFFSQMKHSPLTYFDLHFQINIMRWKVDDCVIIFRVKSCLCSILYFTGEKLVSTQRSSKPTFHLLIVWAFLNFPLIPQIHCAKQTWNKQKCLDFEKFKFFIFETLKAVLKYDRKSSFNSKKSIQPFHLVYSIVSTHK